MRIDGINIEEFADGEHRGLDVNSVDGDSLLLVGGSRTGKTLTFNAVLYNLLGARETIDLATGRSNRVALDFDDGTSFVRGNPQAEYDDGDSVYESDEAKEQFHEKLGEEKLVKGHFIHSNNSYLPLDQLSKEERVSLIREVTNKEVEELIQRHRWAKNHLEELAGEAEDSARRHAEQLEDVERQISETERQIEKYRELQERLKSGDLERVRDALVADHELENQLSELYERQEGLRQQIRRKRRLRRKQENYAEEVRTVIAEAVNDFVCPTCDRRISTEKAEERLKRNYCPFCARDHSLTELKQNVEEKIEHADEILEQLNEEITALEEERDAIQDEIEDLKTQRPELSELDGFTKRKLSEHDYDLASVENTVTEELDKLRETLQELRRESAELEEKSNASSEMLEAYQSSLEEARATLEELEENSFEADIATFTSRWEEVYQELSSTIGLEINVTAEGDVQLPGRNTLREYDRSGDLSATEVRLLNIAFAYTLNEFATQNGLLEWETVVLDEPFTNLDTSNKEDTIEFIQNSEKQFIITTSDDSLPDSLTDAESFTLDPDPIQTTMDDFI